MVFTMIHIQDLIDAVAMINKEQPAVFAGEVLEIPDHTGKILEYLHLEVDSAEDIMHDTVPLLELYSFDQDVLLFRIGGGERVSVFLSYLFLACITRAAENAVRVDRKHPGEFYSHVK